MQRQAKLAVFLTILGSGVWAQSECSLELVTGNEAEEEFFGTSIALDGDTLAVGAVRYLGDVGAVYVLNETKSGWSTAQVIAAPVGGEFGNAVALEGDTLLVGAHGAGMAYVYERTQGTWFLSSTLFGTGDGVLDGFGTEVALNGDCAFVGAPDAGAVYVFERSSGWIMTQELHPWQQPGGQRFGEGLASGADLLVVGAPNAPGVVGAGGALYLYRQSAGSWTPAEWLVPADGMVEDKFGSSVAVNEGGTIVVAGAPASGTGAAYIFREGPFGLIQEAKFVNPGTSSSFGFGTSVSALSETVAVGDPSSGLLSVARGAVHVFDRDPVFGWDLTASLWSKGNGAMGTSIAMAENRIAAGAPDYTFFPVFGAGVAYIFESADFGAPLLACGEGAISVAQGGEQLFQLRAGLAHAWGYHLMLGSFSGTVPGLPLGLQALPLNPDIYLLFTVMNPNTQPLVNSLGPLDDSGSAYTLFKASAGLLAGLEGATISHAFVVFDPVTLSIEFASNAVQITLLP